MPKPKRITWLPVATFGAGLVLAASAEIWGGPHLMWKIALIVGVLVMIVSITWGCVEWVVEGRYKQEIARPERVRTAQRAARQDLEREDLWKCAASLIDRTKYLMHRFNACAEDAQNEMYAQWHSERENLSKTAERFLSHEHIYRLAQDVMSRCDIVVMETRQHGESGFQREVQHHEAYETDRLSRIALENLMGSEVFALDRINNPAKKLKPLNSAVVALRAGTQGGVPALSGCYRHGQRPQT